jgi:hypothetical protein
MIEVTVSDGKLIADLMGRGKAELVAQSQTLFAGFWGTGGSASSLTARACPRTSWRCACPEITGTSRKSRVGGGGAAFQVHSRRRRRARRRYSYGVAVSASCADSAMFRGRNGASNCRPWPRTRFVPDHEKHTPPSHSSGRSRAAHAPRATASPARCNRARCRHGASLPSRSSAPNRCAWPQARFVRRWLRQGRQSKSEIATNRQSCCRARSRTARFGLLVPDAQPALGYR